MNPQVTALIGRAQAALKGQPAWGHTLCVDFKSDGVLYVYANNAVAPIPNADVSADCTLHFPKGVVSLQNLEDKDETAMQEWWRDELTWDGDRSIAEQFVSLIQAAKG